MHLGGQLFATREGLDMVHVPYRGEGDAIKDLVAGETQMETGVASAFLQFIRAGKLRVLVATRTGSGDGYGQQAFFFLDGHYLGTDAKERWDVGAFRWD